ncbi:Gfo/Idh/MocA family oxidoreductase [Erysipelotrichaceae bacterium HCN-30851]
MKLGIAGAGMIVVQGLLQFVHEISGIEIVGISATKRSEEKLKRLSEEYHIPYTFTDYDEMLGVKEIDTVYVAVTNELHYEFCKKAILAGKHVICEKPFTICVDEVKELYDLAKQHQVILLEAITNQYSPNYLKIKEEVKKLGNIHVVSCNYSQYSSRYDAFKRGEILPAFDADKAGGALMDLNVYNIYFTVGLFGMPKHVQYFANIEQRVDTSGILVLEYENFKAVCIGAKDCEAPSSAIIEGENGYLKAIGPASVCATVDYKYRDTKEEGTFNNHTDEHRMKFEFVEFERIIREHDMASVEQAERNSIMVMEVITLARKSSNQA